MERHFCDEGKLIQIDLLTCERMCVELTAAVSNRASGDLQMSQNEMVSQYSELARTRKLWDEHQSNCDHCSPSKPKF